MRLLANRQCHKFLVGAIYGESAVSGISRRSVERLFELDELEVEYKLYM